MQMSAAKFVYARGEKSHFLLRTISLSQTKRANNSAKNNNSFLKKHANKKAM